MEANGFSYVNFETGKFSYVVDVGYGILGFLESIWIGAKLSLLNRRFFCEILIHLLVYSLTNSLSRVVPIVVRSAVDMIFIR